MKKNKEESKKQNGSTRNIQSDGIAEDLIRSFVQFGCAEAHCKTLIEKYNAQLENGITDDMQGTVEKIGNVTEEMNYIAELRRGIMLRLFSMFDSDKDYWCLVKHIGVGSYELYESYMASDDDPEIYAMYLESNKRFIKALTNFLGMEPIDCAACFADALKGETNG